MKKTFLSLLIFANGLAAIAQNSDTKTGEALYATVRKFVSLGEHRTATPVDFATSAWLKTELEKSGFNTQYVEFSLCQFFFESGKITLSKSSIEIFPFWHVNGKINQSIKGILVDGNLTSDIHSVKSKLVLTRFPASGGGLNVAIKKQITQFIEAGAIGILGITPGNTGEIVAQNTSEISVPWSVPVYHIAPKDSNALKLEIETGKPISIEIKGISKEVVARDIVGKIGSGSKFVVISTPISGWFTCGGERGPGIAAWLHLAQWIGQNRAKFSEYTFVFTGNSGHELNGLGAEAFVDKAAPKPEQTRLWIHLGAAIAVKGWKQENGKFILTEKADTNRYFYYDESLAPSFEPAFINLKARKGKGSEENKTTIKPGGEGSFYKERGYKNLVSFAYAHRYHHVKTDDERYTSPALLLEITSALKEFIGKELGVETK